MIISYTFNLSFIKRKESSTLYLKKIEKLIVKEKFFAGIINFERQCHLISTIGTL